MKWGDRMDRWRVLRREVVVDNAPYNVLRRDHVQLPTGQEMDYYVNVYGDWVNALVVTPDNQVVLLQQYRHGIEQVMQEIPGGMMEPGENPAAAIEREVREETGYASDEAPIFLGQFYPNPATSTNQVHCYLLRNARRVGEQRLDATEDILVQEVPLVEVGKMIRGGTLPHLFSVATFGLAMDWFRQQHD